MRSCRGVVFVWSGLFPLGFVISSWLVTNAVLRSNGWNPIIPASNYPNYPRLCRALPGKNTGVFACLVRLPGLKVYHLEKTNNRSPDVLMERQHGAERGSTGPDATSNTILYSASSCLSVYPFTSLSFCFSFISGRS